MVLNNRIAFTLAEVLITLGIVGVIAVLTIPILINKYQNQVYLESLKKSYSTLQNAHLRLIDEQGDPKNWILYHYAVDKDDTKNKQIAESYARYLIGKYCGYAGSSGRTACINLDNSTSFKVLNGENATGKVWYANTGFYHCTYQYNLSSGGSIAILFAQNPAGGVFWQLINKKIRILYILDVNGNKKPNQVGRDIYYFTLNNNENNIVPYYNGTSDCKKDEFGYSCANDIINNGWQFPKDYPY